MTIVSTKKTYVGAGIILVRPGLSADQDQYLLLKGKETGVWSFSKGHPEACDNNHPLATAVRETYEETGLEAGIDYEILGDSIRFGKRPYWMGIMKADARRIIVARVEHETAGWFTWADIKGLTANTDVRCWIKKSRGVNGEFMRLTSLTALLGPARPLLPSY
jgi:8-oxo-dGTP pyrophosphatase MutT (NUDIX family)